MTQARPREASHLGGPERNILYLIFWLKISPLNLDFGSVVTNQCSIKLTNVFKCEVFRIKRSKIVTKRVKWVIPITGLQLIARAAGNAKILVALYWSSMCCAGLCLVFTQVAHWFDLLSDKIYSYIAKPCPPASSDTNSDSYTIKADLTKTPVNGEDRNKCFDSRKVSQRSLTNS